MARSRSFRAFIHPAASVQPSRSPRVQGRTTLAERPLLAPASVDDLLVPQVQDPRREILESAVSHAVVLGQSLRHDLQAELLVAGVDADPVSDGRRRWGSVHMDYVRRPGPAASDTCFTHIRLLLLATNFAAGPFSNAIVERW